MITTTNPQSSAQPTQTRPRTVSSVSARATGPKPAPGTPTPRSDSSASPFSASAASSSPSTTSSGLAFPAARLPWAVLYLTACWLVLTRPVDRYTFPIIITVACACRIVTVYADPFLSSDIYRYTWDGVVQHAHISPYRYVPGDKVLAFLREPNLELFNNMNRRDYARTIYPPAAQFLFYLVTFISPTVVCMKTFMILFEGLTAWALVKLFNHLGYRREQLLLYAWCPMLIWEIGGSGHLDSVAMAYIALALLFRFRLRPRAHRRLPWSCRHHQALPARAVSRPSTAGDPPAGPIGKCPPQ